MEDILKAVLGKTSPFPNITSSFYVRSLKPNLEGELPGS